MAGQEPAAPPLDVPPTEWRLRIESLPAPLALQSWRRRAVPPGQHGESLTGRGRPFPPLYGIATREARAGEGDGELGRPYLGDPQRRPNGLDRP